MSRAVSNSTGVFFVIPVLDRIVKVNLQEVAVAVSDRRGIAARDSHAEIRNGVAPEIGTEVVIAALARGFEAVVL